MPKRVSVDDLGDFYREVEATLEALQGVLKNQRIADGVLSPRAESGFAADDLSVIARAAQLALVASSAGLGECRAETPYAPLYPLIDHDGAFKWCCTHDPNHCAP